MNGLVDANGRSMLSIDVRADSQSQPVAVDVWVDTGFTGDLVLPQPLIEDLGVGRSGSVDAILADGTQIELNTYTLFINWFGENRRLEVVANDGDCPLLGVGLLLGLELRINYRSLKVSLDVA